MTDTTQGGGALPPQIRTLMQFLQSVGNGDIITEAEEQLAKIALALSEHVQDYGGEPKASLTLKLDFKLKKGIVDVGGTVRAKLPDAPAHGGAMWISPENRFTQQHPGQYQMFPQGAKPVRAVD